MWIQPSSAPWCLRDSSPQPEDRDQEPKSSGEGGPSTVASVFSILHRECGLRAGSARLERALAQIPPWPRRWPAPSEISGLKPFLVTCLTLEERAGTPANLDSCRVHDRVSSFESSEPTQSAPFCSLPPVGGTPGSTGTLAVEMGSCSACCSAPQRATAAFARNP
ncbi:hypothetical protein AAFF_G00310810 [Aldrovandia affinis]|uniref:Uncharacterized protein n=1 Tax=Aldrovandia affinis TaxID=143900 RepID=A0AAD7R7Y2_9TELE|nr:hypothetical protein AAFF_G00310810 [Aldrovandia affinis]